MESQIFRNISGWFAESMVANCHHHAYLGVGPTDYDLLLSSHAEAGSPLIQTATPWPGGNNLSPPSLCVTCL